MVTDSAGAFTSGPVPITYSNLLSFVSVRAPGWPPVDRLVVLVDYATTLDFVLDTLGSVLNTAFVECDGMVYRLTAWVPGPWNVPGSGPSVFRMLYTVVNASGAPRRLEFPFLCTSPESYGERIVSEAVVSYVTGPAGEPLHLFSFFGMQCDDAWTSITLAPGDSIAMAHPPTGTGDYDTVTVCAHLPGYEPQSAMCMGVRFSEPAALRPGTARPAPAQARPPTRSPVYDLQGRAVPSARRTRFTKPGVYVAGSSRKLVLCGARLAPGRQSVY
jgi:hypothetical protein